MQDRRKKAAVRLVEAMSQKEQERFGLMSAAPLTAAAAKKNLILANKLLRVERIFPVNSLTAGDVVPGLLMWPYLRHLLWVRAQFAYRGKNAAKVNTSEMRVSRSWRQHYAEMFQVHELDELAEQELDFLFFTNVRGTEQTLINGRIYNRITDPIFEVASKLGRAKKVEVIKSAGEIYPHRVHDVELVLPPMLRKVGYAPSTPLDFIDRVKNELPETKFDTTSYNVCVESFFHQRDFFMQLLQRYNPRVVFFVGFDYHYALIVAAKELGIETVDIQHGVQAGWSPVYNHWTAVPRRGYRMLPDTFWVWGEYDAGKIRDTFGRNPDECGVRSLVGGFPWLDRQQDLDTECLPARMLKLQQQLEREGRARAQWLMDQAKRDQAETEQKERLLAEQSEHARLLAEEAAVQAEQLELAEQSIQVEPEKGSVSAAHAPSMQEADAGLAHSENAESASLVQEEAREYRAPQQVLPARKIGLLTLQDQRVFPPLFAQIIEQSTDRIAWIVKRHPKYLAIDLSAINGKALYGKDFDSVSFMNLIRVAEIHLTECSTAVIEADYFGVPSVVTGEQGSLNYEYFIEQRTVHHVESAEIFRERLDSILATGGESRMGVVDNSGLEQALRDLLRKHSTGEIL